MKCTLLLVVLFFLGVCAANAQTSPYTYTYNTDGYYNVLTWGPWQHTLYERYYTNKLFYIPVDGSPTKSFYFVDQTGGAGPNGIDFDKNSCSAGSRDWHFKLYYTFGSDPYPYYSRMYTPTAEGTTNVTMTNYSWNEGHCSSHNFPADNTTIFASFTITVEKPQWKSTVSVFNNICQDVNTNFNLADYFSVSGATYNLDYAGDTTWQYPTWPNFTHDYQLDNGLYTLDYPLIWVNDPDPNDQAGGYWDYDYTAIPDTTWSYPGFPNYTQDYQRSNGMFTANPQLITTINPHNLSPGVHTVLAIKYYDNGANDAAYGSHRGAVQIPMTVTVLPGAPVVGNVAVTPSCPGAPSGTIAITGVSGGDGHYRYILRNGLNNNNTCDPKAGTCFDVSSANDFSGDHYTITGIKDGDYTLWIANNGGNTGACARTYNITVGKLSVMDTLPITIQNISCPGGSNGSINVTDTGGLAPYTFTLTTTSNTWTNTTGGFTNLLSGSYVLNTQDGCQHSVQRTIVLTEPLPVTVSTTASATDCNTPANGAIDVKAGGGSGTFDYYLYDSVGNVVTQQLASTNTTWSIGAVGAGKYTAKVYNTAAPGCAATTQPVVVIGPPDLSISYISQTNNNCSYDAIGTLQLGAGGGQANGYIFFLQNITTGQVQQSTTGGFSGLPAAAYKAWVRNRDLSCNDSVLYASPINITAPPLLKAVASATDITCNGKGDGTLQATISGGTLAYNLQWQQWDAQAGNWLPMSGLTAASASNLQKGTYRLQVSDHNSCTAVSDTVTIAEPNSLLITKVDRNDIVCYGSTGTIQMTVSGGNGSYVYAYSTDNGTNWTNFTATTALTAATYQLKVSDSKNCVTPYNQPVEITTPSQALAISYTLTDYNGFNVPCYGSDNGEVKLSATGGNGSTYTGYTFTLDNGTYTTSNIVYSTAGNHTFYVKDARGCVVNVTATLTQPLSQMQTVVSNQLNNDCAGGKAGAVTVTTTGGTPQFTFSIDHTHYQSSPTFNNLVSAIYQVNVLDINGCADSIKTTVIDLNPPIVDQGSINNVLCNNGSDGSITLHNSGGVPAYSYAWKNSTVTGNVLSGLPAGNYYVTITDSKGCAIADSFTVTQPLQPLSATVYARPVCVNNPYGNIIFYAQGGTAPYYYSINDGSSYSSKSQFNNIVAGSYPIKVMDANACTWTGAATVAVNNTNPNVNFLVSTRQNALDTLQIKDICVPKPDSIQWTFDPQTVVIDTSMYHPLIRYNQQGNYTVGMRAWFAGCDFYTSKVVTINPYDPGVVNNYNNLFGIDTVIVSPNPNNGIFNLQVKLYRKQRLLVKMYTVDGVIVWTKQWDYTDLVQEPITLQSNVANGLVFIKVITDDDARDVQMLINR